MITKHNFSGWTPEQLREFINFCEFSHEVFLDEFAMSDGFFTKRSLEYKQAAQEALDEPLPWPDPNKTIKP